MAKKVETIKRKCLCCYEMFDSAGPGNRICLVCILKRKYNFYGRRINHTHFHLRKNYEGPS